MPPDQTNGSLPLAARGGEGVSVDELMRRARWPILRRLGFHPGGDELSRFRGTGIEYADVREYQAGDDPRTIEWNITARSDRPFVRESTPDRGADIWLIADISRSLDWGTTRVLKRQLAVEFAAATGQLLTARGNRVGALLFDDHIRAIVPPLSGRTALLRLIARLQREGGGSEAAPTDLARAVVEASRLMRRASLVLLLTDFMSADGWQRPLSAMAMRHEVVAVWLSDPREREIPDVGVVTFEDPESGQQLLVDTRSQRLRDRFAQAAQAQRDTIRAELRRCRVGIAEFDTSAELVPQLIRFIKQRETERSARHATLVRQ